MPRISVDIRDYGISTSTADCTTVVNQTITDISDDGGGVLCFPTGSYTFLGQVILKHGVTILGVPGGTEWDFSDCASFANTLETARIRATNTEANSTTVTAAIAAGDGTITVASTTGYSIGDFIHIASSESDYYSSSYEGTKGELNRVGRVLSSTSLELSSPTFDSYTISGQTVTVKRVPDFEVGLHGIRFKGKGINGYTSGTRADIAVSLEGMTRVHIADCEWVDMENVGAALFTCTRVVIERNTIVFTSEDLGLEYGFHMYGACQDVTIRDNWVWNARHSINGSGGTGGEVRMVSVEGNHFINDWSAALNTHAGAEFWTMTGNTVRSKAYCAFLRGRNFTVTGNQFYSPNAYGVLISTRPGQVSITGNHFNGPGTGGVFVRNDAIATANKALARELSVIGNTFTNMTWGVRIYPSSTSSEEFWEGTRIVGNAFRDIGTGRAIDTFQAKAVVIADNQFHTGLRDAIRVDSTTGAVITGNHFRDFGSGSAIRFTGTAATRCIIAHNILTNTDGFVNQPVDADSIIADNITTTTVASLSTGFESCPRNTDPESEDFNELIIPSNIATTDAGDPDAFDTVSAGAGTTLTYDNTYVRTGGGEVSAKVVTTDGTIVHVQWDSQLGTRAEHYGRMYCYFTANPGARVHVMRALSGASPGPSVAVETNGKITSRNAAGAIDTSTATIPTGAWFRLEWHIIHSATVGQIIVRLFSDPDSVTPTETLTSAASYDLLASIDRIRFGVAATATGAATYWMDGLSVQFVDWIGP